MFDQVYEQKLKKAWLKKYKNTADNIQEKFIFNVEGGAHSVHLQKKHASKLSAIIHDYLNFIELMHEREEANLW